MKRHRRGWPVLLLLVVCVGRSSPCFAQKANAGAGSDATRQAGYPLVAARRTAIDARSFQRPLDRIRIRKWMELGSRTTMAEFELFLAPLSPPEAKLLEKIEHMPAPIVNRLPLADLRGVLKNGGLLSLYREEQLRRAEVKHTTPAIENELFGGYDCVFASVGPPDGSPRYGDAIIRLRDSVREHGWATPFSGMHFIYAIRHKNARTMQNLLAQGQPLPTAATDPLSLGFDDRLHFSHYAVAEKDWNKALAYQALLVLRNLDASAASERVRQRFAALLAEDDAAKFWALFIPAMEPGLPAAEEAARVPFGYLEGKFADKVSIEDFTSIEVPPAQLAEVRAWPEAQPYLPLIRAKAEGVR